MSLTAQTTASASSSKFLNILGGRDKFPKGNGILKSSKKHSVKRTRFIISVVILVVIGAGLLAFSLSSSHTPSAAKSLSAKLVDQQTPTASTSTVNSTTTTNETGTSNSSSNGTNSNNVKVTVNGQPINVPENGIVSQSIENGDSQTNVNVSSDHTTNASSGSSSSNSSSTTVNVNQSSN